VVRHGVMASGVGGRRKMLARRFRMMQCMRSIEREQSRGINSEPNPGESDCQYARQFHPVNILSTMDFVPCVRLQ
jgi:hypothetical protein